MANPNATRGYFCGKSLSHSRLVKQRQLNKDENGKRKSFNFCVCVVQIDVVSLVYLSCSQIWNIAKEKDRERKKVGDRSAKINEKKGDRQLEREIKKMKTFFCWKNNMKIS